ncbi:ArsA family ATPase [Anaerocolumna sp. MB42-C2]|uniref:ArsA family ATPase n=1 Tax=Anaerocolumna sp. MB42-C2 TaxID=3070997 RepID=UPI0027E20F94|nr:ArsA family ATPase [Anaerocolumna sp. MB42-C2]WMJ90278.1 ArsA family ATPase [Anaerocolumna sp. MB42-C2]
MRVIIYTGKGGVGKTSVAAATACKIAETGKKVMIMSTDQAHSLGDSFGIKLGKEITRVTNSIDALEIDTVYESEKSWGNLKNYFKQLLTVQSENSIEVEELLVFPGLEELFSLFKILDIYEQNQYDALIVDCAPTGETLALLKYPEKLSGIFDKVLPIKRKAAKVAGPVVEKVMKIPMPKDNVFDDLTFLMDKLAALQTLMLNKEIVSLRIVTTPEKIVISETKRNFTCLYLYNYNVDAIIVNRIYPKEAMEGYFSKWVLMQQDRLEEINQSFSEVPKLRLPLLSKELRTLEVLKEAGEILFEEVDPLKVLFSKEIYQVKRLEEDKVSLRILLPFAEKESLDLRQEAQEIILAIKNEVRRFPIPSEVNDKEITSAKFEDGYLNIMFQPVRN